MKKCSVCGDESDFVKIGTIDEFGKKDQICVDCDDRLNTMVALVIAEGPRATRTGESVFIGRSAFRKYAPELTPGSDIYIITKDYIKIVVKRMIYEKV